MYLLTGIITMWVIRLGLVAFLIIIAIAGNNDRLNHTITERTGEQTWINRNMTVKEYIKNINILGWSVLLIIIILLVLSWLTLWWW